MGLARVSAFLSGFNRPLSLLAHLYLLSGRPFNLLVTWPRVSRSDSAILEDCFFFPNPKISVGLEPGTWLRWTNLDGHDLYMIYAAPRIRRQRLAGIIPHLLSLAWNLLTCLDSYQVWHLPPHTKATPNEQSTFSLIRLGLSLFAAPVNPPPLLYDPTWMAAQQYPCWYKPSYKHTCSRCGPSIEPLASCCMYISVCKCVAASPLQQAKLC